MEKNCKKEEEKSRKILNKKTAGLKNVTQKEEKEKEKKKLEQKQKKKKRKKKKKEYKWKQQTKNTIHRQKI